MSDDIYEDEEDAAEELQACDGCGGLRRYRIFLRRAAAERPVFDAQIETDINLMIGHRVIYHSHIDCDVGCPPEDRTGVVAYVVHDLTQETPLTDLVVEPLCPN